MYKKIFGLFFSLISLCTFSMEQPVVTLGLIGNESDTLYRVTYGSGSQIDLYSRQVLSLNQALFCLLPNQQFPISEKIVFNENSRGKWLFQGQGPQRVRVLDLTIVKHCLLNLKSPYEEKNHTLESNKKYTLNVGIDSKHNVFYSLTPPYILPKEVK